LPHPTLHLIEKTAKIICSKAPIAEQDEDEALCGCWYDYGWSTRWMQKGWL